MSKVLIAIGGTGTDTTTLYRCSRTATARRPRAPASRASRRCGPRWSGRSVRGVRRLQEQTLSAALDGDLDGYELVKAHATLAYGELRPVDKIYIATVQSGTDEVMLFEGLARCNLNTIEADFRRTSSATSRSPTTRARSGTRWTQSSPARTTSARWRCWIASPTPSTGGSSGVVRRRAAGGNQRLVALVKAAVQGRRDERRADHELDRRGHRARTGGAQGGRGLEDPLGLTGFFGDLSQRRAEPDEGEARHRGEGRGRGRAASSDASSPTRRAAVAQPRRCGREHDLRPAQAVRGRHLGALQGRVGEGERPFNDYVSANMTAIEKGYADRRTIFCDLDHAAEVLLRHPQRRRGLLLPSARQLRRPTPTSAGSWPTGSSWPSAAALSEQRARAGAHAAEAVGPDAGGEREVAGADGGAREERLLRPVLLDR